MNKMWQILLEGFSYEGSLQHIIINYSLLVITILPHFVQEQLGKRRLDWLWVLITAVFVQVLVWFFLNASGISIIWCSVTGYNLLFYGNNVAVIKKVVRILFAFSFLMVLVVIFYYYLILPLVTTIAHIMAILMGFGLFLIYRISSGKSLPKRL